MRLLRRRHLTKQKQSRSVLIAGGAGGMGLAAARRFAETRDRIVIADLPGERLIAANRHLSSLSGHVLTLAFDIRSPQQCRDMVKSAVAWGGGLDVLINAAGVWHEGSSANVTEDEWDRVIDVN